MKNRLLKGEHIEIEDDNNLIELWFQKRTNNFCLMLNGVLIKSNKTFKPIESKLKTITK